MASPLPPEQRASYSAIIDQILASSDLTTISAKRIRKGLQERVDYDLGPQKRAITDLIMERFDRAESRQSNGVAPAVAEPLPTANGGLALPPRPVVKNESADASSIVQSPAQSPNKRKAADEDQSGNDLSDVVDSPPAKKVKPSKAAPSGDVESDEVMAARLQAELNAQNGRSTRGGGTKRKTPAKKEKKTTKKKSSAKVNADDDSELDGESSEKPVKERKGGFHKPMNLSQQLTDLLNETTLSRPQTVKKIWEYVRARQLQDPSDKRWIICDDKMHAVFKTERVNMFSMNKVIAQHLYPAEEAQ